MICQGLFKEHQHIWGDHEFLVMGMWLGGGEGCEEWGGGELQGESQVAAAAFAGSPPLLITLRGRPHIPALEEGSEDQRG